MSEIIGNSNGQTSADNDIYGWATIMEGIGKSVGEIMDKDAVQRAERLEIKQAIVGPDVKKWTEARDKEVYEALWNESYDYDSLNKVFEKELRPYDTVTPEDFQRKFGYPPGTQFNNTLYKDEYIWKSIEGAPARKLFCAAVEKENYNPDVITVSLFRVADFYADYPTAFDFVHAKDIQTDKIEFTEKDLMNFVHTMYGEKQAEYLEQLSKLTDEATERMTSGGFYPKVENMESGERLFADAATRVVSKNQVSNGNGGETFEDGTSQDAVYGNGGENLFAVFDGMGGVEGGRTASHECVNNLANWADDIDITTDSGKQALISSLSGSVSNGAATATIVKIVEGEDMQKYAHFVSVGDSRLYHVHRKNYFEPKGEGFINHVEPFTEQVTKDDDCPKDLVFEKAREKFPDCSEADFDTMYDWIMNKPITRQITPGVDFNSIMGFMSHMIYHGVTKGVGVGANFKVSAGNAGVIRLEPGDSLVLCSDGIYGSTPEQQLSPDFISMAVSGQSAEDALENLMANATKVDDRSAIVVKV